MKRNCVLGVVLFVVALMISSHLSAVPSMKIQFSGKATVRGVTPKNNSVCLYLAIVNKAQTSTSWSNDGTSTGGGQPSSCVTVSTSTEGEFSVTLGDTALTNMTALPESTFNTTTSDLYLAVWLKADHASLGSFSTEQLTPNILLTSAPYAAGSSTITVGGPQVLTVNITTVGTVGTGEDDLMSYTLAANAMPDNKDVLRITASGPATSRDVTPRVRCYFGSTLIADSGTVAGDEWYMMAHVVRKTQTTQEAIGILNSWHSTTLVEEATVARATPSQDLSSSVTIKCTGQSTDAGASAADDDIQQTLLMVELLN